MKRFTLLYALFCLICPYTLAAQEVELVASGLAGPNAIALDNELLYIAEGGGNISVVNLDDPLPAAASPFASSSPVTSLLAKEDFLYFTSAGSIKVGRIPLDGSSTEAEDLLSSDTDLNLYEIADLGDKLYVAAVGPARTGGIFELDLALPFPQDLKAVIADFNTSALAIKDSVIYHSFSRGSEVWKTDLRQSSPTLEIVVSGLDRPDGLTIQDNFLYISEAGEGRISRIDINQDNPIVETVVEGPSGPTVVDLDGIYLYFTEFGSGEVSRITIGKPSLPTFAPVCADQGAIQLGGATPTGGVYSGPGVTDDANGETFTFDPIAAGGAGSYAITYSIGGQDTTATLGVVDAPAVTFPTLGSVNLNAGVQSGLGGATPSGGTYTGTGVTDDGNGTTFSFDPAAAGEGTQTITYTLLTDSNPCTASATATINVVRQVPPGDSCAIAIPLDSLFGRQSMVAQVSDTFDNTGYMSYSSDPAQNLDCGYNITGFSPIWFTFSGDGNPYTIKSTGGYDLVASLYSGNCDSLVAITCNDDDIDLNFGLEFDTEDGVEYYVLASSADGSTDAFNLEVTNLGTSAVTNFSRTGFSLYPNPTTGRVQLDGLTADRIEIFDHSGRTVRVQAQRGNSCDLSGLPPGFYVLKMTSGRDVYSAKVIKE